MAKLTREEALNLGKDAILKPRGDISRGGRKKKDPKKKLSSRISIYLTEDESKKLKEHAEKMKCSISEYIVSFLKLSKAL